MSHYLVRVNAIESFEYGGRILEEYNIACFDSLDAARQELQRCDEVYLTHEFAERKLYDYYHVPNAYRGYRNCVLNDMLNKTWYIEASIWLLDEYFDEIEQIDWHGSREYECDYHI